MFQQAGFYKRRRMKGLALKFITWEALLVFSSFGAGQTNNAATQGAAPVADSVISNVTNTQPPSLQSRNPRYRLAIGDSLELTFPFTPEFNQTVVVQPDGYVTLAGGVGDLYVVGNTIPETRERLLVAYSKILHQAVINIGVREFEKPFFIAGGEVAHPGKYDLRGDVTLTEGVELAGGFTENSKHSHVLIFRRRSNQWVEIGNVNIKQSLATGNLSEDIHLQSGDMFYVPQNRISKVRRYIPSPGIGMTVVPY